MLKQMGPWHMHLELAFPESKTFPSRCTDPSAYQRTYWNMFLDGIGSCHPRPSWSCHRRPHCQHAWFAESLTKIHDCALHLESKRETGEYGGNMLMTAKLPFSNLRISIQFPTGVVIVGSSSCRFWNLLVAGAGLAYPFELQKPRQRERHILSWWAATRWFHGCFRQRGEKLGPHPLRSLWRIFLLETLIFSQPLQEGLTGRHWPLKTLRDPWAPNPNHHKNSKIHRDRLKRKGDRLQRNGLNG